MRIEVKQECDELGNPNEFTWDLFPLVDSKTTLHLLESGLPRPGTQIRPGMIIVGKIAKSKTFATDGQPSSLEIHGLDRDVLVEKYGHMWLDRSYYATTKIQGTVKDSFFETREGELIAVVLIE